ncbi:TVP38/TMEM64 family protein [Staphylococcus epidermidis]|uniref:TVP38/TMEM64 family protein n=1 Tax=Staphylococcus epidermidis TaxID=1282 RepID=UPI0007355D1C|nr:TVP38/TMEM64 family protein [Staphylococcus epidermidis]MBF2205165.1 TVP38/TMEM64 family protein [Staphylococcus epidermidis]MBF2208996.1 TVP38/TMEM64 family protein [Staphylococcus epidermidis]MBF2210958.1 TVP38/TMEM64 family protein [Staphylococcus epidermidis]MCC3697926.1 TVP38/TMEM64 family protein [Staphylococcus epidermidis]MCG1196216.1 TVP38/TMEM64 family protein [Staphylococcus epidermidis]
MSLSQLEEWFDAFRQFGYIPGFIMLYLRAIVPVLPLTLYVVLLIHAYGLFPGIIISWLGIVSGTFTVFLICKKLVNTIRMKKLKSRKSVQRLISFIDRQGLIPLFILLCFPFTPNTLINIIASLSHIKIKYYFLVLVISKLISITILGVMGKEIFTIFTNPLRALIMIVLLVVLWFISKKVEKYFMGSTKE